MERSRCCRSRARWCPAPSAKFHGTSLPATSTTSLKYRRRSVTNSNTASTSSPCVEMCATCTMSSITSVQPGPFTTTGAGPTLRLTDGRTITRSYFSTNENLNTFAADNQLQAKFNMGPLQHTVLAGFDYQRFDFNNFARFAGLPPTRSTSWRRTTPRTSRFPPRIFQSLDQRLQQRGFFVQDEAKLGRLTVLGGVRYDWAEGKSLAQKHWLARPEQRPETSKSARSTTSTPVLRPM